jgi:antitoxin CcdA
MAHLYDSSAPKKPTNLSLNSDLLEKARSLKINLSATLEIALEKQIRESERARWLNENRQAIGKLNELAEKNGLFSDSFRDF